MPTPASEFPCAAERRQFAEHGYVKLPGLLSRDDADAAAQASESLFAGESQSPDDYKAWSKLREWKPMLTSAPGKDTVFFDFLGLSPVLDAAVERVMSAPAVQTLLRSALGWPYRAWYCQVRRANPAGPSLRMHQDLPGELSLSILLSDVASLSGTTVFLPRSHRWPRVLGRVPIYPRAMRPWLAGATGNKGDVYLFFNSTWHGRPPTRKPATAILLSFLPMEFAPSGREPPRELLDRLGPCIRQTMDPAVRGPGVEIRPSEEPFNRLLHVDGNLSAVSPWKAIKGVNRAVDAAIGVAAKLRGR